jgi:hypothetical protein
LFFWEKWLKIVFQPKREEKLVEDISIWGQFYCNYLKILKFFQWFWQKKWDFLPQKSEKWVNSPPPPYDQKNQTLFTCERKWSSDFPRSTSKTALLPHHWLRWLKIFQGFSEKIFFLKSGLRSTTKKYKLPKIVLNSHSGPEEAVQCKNKTKILSRIQWYRFQAPKMQGSNIKRLSFSPTPYFKIAKFPWSLNSIHLLSNLLPLETYTPPLIFQSPFPHFSISIPLFLIPYPLFPNLQSLDSQAPTCPDSDLLLSEAIQFRSEASEEP